MNDDLPILDELGAEYRALVARELELERERERERPVAAIAAAPAPVRPVRPQRARRRIARRIPVTVSLLFLLTTTALAARSLVGGQDTPPDTPPIVLGADARAGWTLSAHRHDGRLCLSFVAGGQLTDACTGTPGRGAVLPLSALTPDRRYVAGTSGSAVARVVVRASGRTDRVRTRAPTDEDTATRAGVSPGVRWFVAALPARTALAPATVRPVAADGRASGPVVLDCSLGSDAPACLAAAETAAAHPLP